MAKKKREKKIRAFHIASKCGLPFKEFKQHADALGVTFRSPQNSLAESEASALIEAVKARLSSIAEDASEAVEGAKSAAEATPATTSEEVPKAGQGAYKRQSIHQPPEVQTAADDTASASDAEALHETQEAETRELTRVHFSFWHAHTLPGDSLCVVGDIPELGAWEPEKGLALDADHWPEWRGAVTLPTGTTFSFKLLIRNEHGCFWEAGENRSFATSPEAPSYRVEGEFR